ncbi:CaiB/BaiF CoA transferase family protein [Nocardiopsis potens]|uniref:CaiB/BaiF CoA transferase family protein n=1 Tax=Nocardiopsis potens TaxID=1246458 RepID=UPI00034B09C4|nr:CoA transferase [Nocardiopsis potens]
MTFQAPLSGLRVLDFGQYIAAPGAGQNLADLGADVVKIEGPGGDQARHVGAFGAAMVLANNRGKRSIAVDLRTPDGAAVVRDLLGTADAVLHNFRHGVDRRLGLDPGTLLAAHPRLVCGTVTGFGTRGPSATRVGLDIAAQAEFGVMELTGEPDGPPQRVGFAVADVLAAQALTSGVLAALLARERTGRGTHVETSLMEAMVHAQSSTWVERQLSGTEPSRRGNGQALAAPAADLVRTGDGGWIVLSAYLPAKFRALCEAIGRPELPDDPRFATNDARVRNRPALLGALQDALGRRTRPDALRLLREAGVVSGAVRRFAELADDADLAASGLLVAAGRGGRTAYTAPGAPFSLGGERHARDRPAPAAGEHTRELLAELGRAPAEIRGLLRSGAVSAAEADTGPAAAPTD